MKGKLSKRERKKCKAKPIFRTIVLTVGEADKELAGAPAAAAVDGAEHPAAVLLFSAGYDGIIAHAFAVDGVVGCEQILPVGRENRP